MSSPAPAPAPAANPGASPANHRPPVSGVVICINEADRIGACLDSLAWCEQIIVLDSGSTDQTVRIAEARPGVEVHHRPFDDYIQQKNAALDLCTHDWVMSLDADELLPPALVEEIARLDFDVAGYEIPRQTFLGDHLIRHGTWRGDHKLRLFRRSLGRWGGSTPHERVVIDGPVRRLHTPMLHYSYDSREQYIERNQRYARLLAAHWHERGKRTRYGQAALHAAGMFVKGLILRRGFLDGADGWFLAWHGAAATYRKYAELARLQREAESQRPGGSD